MCQPLVAHIGLHESDIWLSTLFDSFSRYSVADASESKDESREAES